MLLCEESGRVRPGGEGDGVCKKVVEEGEFAGVRGRRVAMAPVVPEKQVALGPAGTTTPHGGHPSQDPEPMNGERRGVLACVCWRCVCRFTKLRRLSVVLVRGWTACVCRLILCVCGLKAVYVIVMIPDLGVCVCRGLSL